MNNKEKQEHFFYLRKPNGRPVGVLAMRKEPDNKTIRFAGSLCSPQDEWNKVAGVNKACGKLNSPEYVVRVEFDKDFDRLNGLAPKLIDRLFEPKHRGGHRCNYLESIERIDMATAQAVLSKQVTHLLTPRPE